MNTRETIRLAGARVTRDHSRAEIGDLRMRGGRFIEHDSAAAADCIDLSGCLLLPGLINAHDHLEFNLFPRLGKGPYPNAVHWAQDIYYPDQSPLREHLAIPKAIRLLWGGIKNLLSGVTTVAHHNPFDLTAFNESFPVRVIRQYGWAHSLSFSADVIDRFQQTPKQWPFVIHAAEGTDSDAFSEVEKMDARGILDERTVLVHAIALRASDIDIVRSRGCSLVWCPTSNLSICGKTIDPALLDSGLPVALGSDSALSAAGDMMDEICTARRFPRVTSQGIFEMLTRKAAQIFRLGLGFGTICDRGPADLVAVRDDGQSPADAVTNLCPEMVIVRGRVRLISDRLLEQNPRLVLDGLQRIAIEGRGEWLIDTDVSVLRKSAEASLGVGFELAGKRVMF
jgi:cytosine/adenosine deaminase-related metal-dependent hydrolase